MFKLATAVVSAALAMSLHSAERLFVIDKAGFLVDTNRFSYATFSGATLLVDEQDGKLCLPCRFTLVPEIGKDKCREIIFLSVSTLENGKGIRQLEELSRRTSANNHSPLPRKLQLDSLGFDVDEDPFNAVIVARQGGGGVDSRDLVLYQKVPEAYFRYLCSSETGGDYWWFKMLGKRIEYRIWPVRCAGDEYVVAESDIRSRYFDEMTLTYARCGNDFHLKKIVLQGDYSYKGGVLMSDPASLEMRGDFARSSSFYIESHINGIVETGCGILKSQRNVKYTMYGKKANERFKVVIEIGETI